MKYIFSTIIFLHGAIHLLGFIKAFDLANIQQLSANISKSSGLIWLFVSVLFVISGVAYIAKFQWWSLLAILAVILSSLLTILVWKDTKFAFLPNVIIMIVACFSLLQVVFNEKVSNEIAQIIGQTDGYKTAKITTEQLSELPMPVANWLKTSGIIGKEKINTVWLSQKAKMKMKPEQETWNNATAEQYFAIEKPAFVWKVNMNMPPFIKIAGRDKFFDGKGEMQIKMFSAINIVNEKGIKIDEGTLQRFLGEIVWFPSAALSPYISWEAIDSLSARATMDYKGTLASGTFYFNKQGDFVKYSAHRYKGNEPDAKRYDWVINVKEHAVMNGIKIPTKMSATWKLDEKDWTWLEMEITDIKYNKKSLTN
ncbi:MAG: hypothetical protein KQH67_01630 [Bacteroidetes bacterium]|nr:hypothetical protein [Bacteroidota bacterium]